MARVGNFDVELNQQGWFDIRLADPINGWFDKVAVGRKALPPPGPGVLPLSGGGGGGGRWPQSMPPNPFGQLPPEPPSFLTDSFSVDLFAEPAPPGQQPTVPQPTLSVEELLSRFDIPAPEERPASDASEPRASEPQKTLTREERQTIINNYWMQPDVRKSRDWFPIAVMFLGATSIVGLGVVVAHLSKTSAEDKKKREELENLLLDLKKKGIL